MNAWPGTLWQSVSTLGVSPADLMEELQIEIYLGKDAFVSDRIIKCIGHVVLAMNSMRPHICVFD